MRIPLAAAVLWLVFGAPAYAGDERWLEVEGSATLAGDMTMDRAQGAALDRARATAVARWAGLTIQDDAYSVRSQSGALDLFRETHAVASGRVIREEVLRWETVAMPVGPKEPPISRVVVHLRAEVAREDAGDPGFQVGLKLSREAFVEGDALSMEVRATEPCFPLVFNLAADGGVYLVYPNSYQALARLSPDSALTLPGDAAPFKLMPRPVTGHSLDVEAIKVVALRHPVDPPKPGAKAGSLRLVELYRWISAIPVHERTETTAEYRVLATPTAPSP